MTPKKRPDLITIDIGQETLVYDPGTSQAHNLNPAAASVFRACDGTASLESLSGSPQDAYALSILADNGLLEGPLPALKAVSRRVLLEIMGKAALIPALLTVATPLPAAAQSGVTEAVCQAGGAGVCGMPCVDPNGLQVPDRICAASVEDPESRCGCVDEVEAVACSPTPCRPARAV